MRISDWSSDVCSSDLVRRYQVPAEGVFSGVVGFTDVTVKAGGSTFEMRIDRVPGSPDWTLSDDDRRVKFHDCAGRDLGEERARDLFGIARDLDTTQLGKESGWERECQLVLSEECGVLI